MSKSLADIMPEIAVCADGRKVVIELICTDEYAAQVVLDDIVTKMTSERGMSLQLRGVQRPENAAGEK